MPPPLACEIGYPLELSIAFGYALCEDPIDAFDSSYPTGFANKGGSTPNASARFFAYSRSDEAGYRHPPLGSRLTRPPPSTSPCPGLMIMFAVGVTYTIGPTLGKVSGRNKLTGMLYFTPW